MVLRNCDWQSVPITRSIHSREVQVWRVFLDQCCNGLRELSQTLSPEEESRAARFHFDLDRQRFQVARGVLRNLLGAYLNLPPQQVRFEYGPYGKPYLAARELQFNLSHSQGIAVYGFTRGRDLGLDLECLRPVPQLLRIAERYFSPQEKAVLQNLAPEQQIERFFQYWTCKEAYLKARGTGLSQPMPQIELDGSAAQAIIINADDPKAENWQIQLLQPTTTAIAAVAVQDQDWFLTCWDYT